MFGRPFGIMLLATALLAAGLAGIAALWAAWPRTSNTSPLAALFALAWSGAYMVAGVLTWRRSRFAAIAYAAALGLLIFPLSFLFPGSGQRFLLLPFVVLVLFTFLGYRYLQKIHSQGFDVKLARWQNETATTGRYFDEQPIESDAQRSSE
jgi:hypothetical protein